jgi:hypothetical protein
MNNTAIYRYINVWTYIAPTLEEVAATVFVVWLRAWCERAEKENGSNFVLHF